MSLLASFDEKHAAGLLISATQGISHDTGTLVGKSSLFTFAGKFGVYVGESGVKLGWDGTFDEGYTFEVHGCGLLSIADVCGDGLLSVTDL